MSLLSLIFDALLGLGLLWLAWRAVSSPGLFASVVLFMVFGFVMAITWARLGAPDLALAEAAISAGLTGALLLSACKAALTDTDNDHGNESAEEPTTVRRRWPAALICTGLGAVLSVVMIQVAANRAAVPPALAEAVSTHPLDNPITVMLLDLRGYDTLLEVTVLLTAFLGVRILLEQTELPRLHAPQSTTPLMVDPLLAMATPVLLMTALYLFWTGMEAPGGAFQAGALLGALGVMYTLTGRFEPLDRTPVLLRLGLILGPGMFSIFACLALTWSEWPLAYPAGATGTAAVAIEFTLMISIALTLTLLFSATPGLRARHMGVRHP